jgi:hypothetical protein
MLPYSAAVPALRGSASDSSGGTHEKDQSADKLTGATSSEA